MKHFPKNVSAQVPVSSACCVRICFRALYPPRVAEEPEFVFSAPNHRPVCSSYPVIILFSSPELRKGSNTLIPMETQVSKKIYAARLELATFHPGS